MSAVRMKGIGRYFGPRLDLKNAPPGEVARNLLIIFGLNVKPRALDQIQVNVMAGVQALHDVSLDIDKGSVVCLVGPSGSGKTTLLRILAGIIPPTEGSAELRGSVSSLLSTGDNLDTTASALENIENQRRLKKIPAERAQAYARGVIEFADLAGFEQAAVRTYSTGMVLRLSVALALQGNPDILLMEDVLGVGDLAFQQKVVERLHELKGMGCTMLLALSDENLVQQLATRVITLVGGRIKTDCAPTQLFIGRGGVGSAEVIWHVGEYMPENDAIAFQSIQLDQHNEDGNLILEIVSNVLPKFVPQQCRPVIDLFQGKDVVFRSVGPQFVEISKLGNMRTSVRFRAELLHAGNYKVGLSFVSRQGALVYSVKNQNAITLEVRRDNSVAAESLPLVATNLPWEVEALSDEPA